MIFDVNNIKRKIEFGYKKNEEKKTVCKYNKQASQAMWAKQSGKTEYTKNWWKKKTTNWCTLYIPEPDFKTTTTILYQVDTRKEYILEKKKNISDSICTVQTIGGGKCITKQNWNKNCV